jgi:hypothetical protein
VRDPLFFRKVKVELVRDLAATRDDDPRAFIGHVTNKAGQRGAAIVDLGVNAPTKPLGARKMGFGRGILLWLLGVPLPIIILLAIFWH